MFTEIGGTPVDNIEQLVVVFCLGHGVKSADLKAILGVKAPVVELGDFVGEGTVAFSVVSHRRGLHF